MMEYTGRSRFYTWFTVGFPVGAIKGIHVRLHFLLVLALIYNWAFYANYPAPLSWRISLWLFSFGALFGSVLLHELGHCYGAYRVGGGAEQIILWPLGGLAYVSGSEKGPREELIVTLAGPLVNLVLAITFTAAGLVAGEFAATPWWVRLGLRHLAFLNWILFVFNMTLPLFPMDAARIVRGLASMRWNPNRVTYYLSTFGIYFGAALAIAGFFNVFPELVGPWLGLIGLLGAFACYQERRRLEFGDVYEDGPWYWRSSVVSSDDSSGHSVYAEVNNIPPAERSSASTTKRKLSPREKLQREMEEATAREDFQRAAILRDRLHELIRREREQQRRG